MAKRKSLDIVVPIYNEEQELEASVKTLRIFLNTHLSRWRWQIVIVDNASTDASQKIGRRLSRLRDVSFMHLRKKGRGHAVRTAWHRSHAAIVGYTDVDLSTDLASLPDMLAALDQYDIAIASRLLPDATVQRRTVLREVISRVYNVLLKVAFRVRFSDAQCGFKFMHRDVFIKLDPVVDNDEWFFDTEILIVAQKSGCSIYEHPVKWRDNPGSTVRVLPTMMEDLRGIVRLMFEQPWKHIVHEKKD